MKLSVERQPASLVVLDITADDDEFAQAMSRAVRRVSRDIQIPGFRKGKAPKSIIERYYGHDVFLREAADDIMETLYRKALEQESLRPVGEPSVEINDLEPVNFVVTVPVYPEVELGDYTSIRVDQVDASVDDSDVDDVVTRLQRARGTWEDVAEERNPVDGDQVTVDYTVSSDGEPFQEPVADAVFVLGETNLLTQLHDKLTNMKVGETESFDLTFGDDDETADPSIRGLSLAYTVTLKSLKERHLPDLDDEFAKAVNDSDSMDALRQEIRDDIHLGKTNDGRAAVYRQAVDEMAAQATIDLPEVMIDDEVEHQISHLKEDLQRRNTSWEGYLRIQGKTEDDLKDDLRPEAAHRLRNSLFLQQLASVEEISVSDEDIEAEIDRVSGPVPTDGDEGETSQAARMAQFYRSDYFRGMLRNQLFEQKVTDRLIDIATEGQGAVTNGFVAPEPELDDVAVVTDDVTAELEADGTIVIDEVVETTDADGSDVIEEVIDIIDADGNETIVDVVSSADTDGAVAEVTEIEDDKA